MVSTESSSRVWSEAFLAGLAPDPRLSIREWADSFRILSTRVSGTPGLWRTSRTPYLGEIMDDLSPSSPVREVVLMGGAQLGKSEAGLNLIGYTIDFAPGPILAVWPSLELARTYSRQRIGPLIEDSPRLAGKVREARSRDSGNTLTAKEFPGGILLLAGANSAVSLRSTPAKTVLLDDIDAFPFDADGEGDPVGLAEARARSFWGMRKIFKTSTPLIRGSSRIETAYLATDRRRFHLPCPSCGLYQVLIWEGIKWEEGKPNTARYECIGCHYLIEHGEKTGMLARGKWVAEKPDADPEIHGYQISSLYSPVGAYGWSDAVKDFLKTRPDGQVQPLLLQTWINTVLGETFVQKGEAPEWERIHERRESYDHRIIPARGLVLTAGVDVQGDRLEATILAWGRGRERWQVDHRVFAGDPEQLEVWKHLDELLLEKFPHASGQALEVRMLAIDSGHATSSVYRWARGHGPGRIMVVRGRGNYPVTLGQPTGVEVATTGKRLRRGVKVWPVGVGLLKSELYGWLRLAKPAGDEPTPGYCHFYELPEDFFRQLTAEELVAKTVKGYRRLEWTKLPGRRNEVLDCHVYARAATILLGMDRWGDERWRRLEAALGVASPPPPAQTRSAEAPPAPETPPRRRGPGGRGRFMDRWRGP